MREFEEEDAKLGGTLVCHLFHPWRVCTPAFGQYYVIVINKK